MNKDESAAALESMKQWVEAMLCATEQNRPGGLDPAIWGRLMELLRNNVAEITSTDALRFIGEVRWGWEWVRWDARAEMRDAGVADLYPSFYEEVARLLNKLEEFDNSPMREAHFRRLDLPLPDAAQSLFVRHESVFYDPFGMGTSFEQEGPMISGSPSAVLALADWLYDLSLLPPGSELQLLDWRLRVSYNYLPPLADEAEDTRTYTQEIWHRFSRMLLDSPSGQESNPLGLRDVFHFYRRPPRNLVIYAEQEETVEPHADPMPESKTLYSGNVEGAIEAVRTLSEQATAQRSERAEQLQQSTSMNRNDAEDAS